MRTKYWVTLAISLVGCGGATGPERTIPSGTERSQETTTSDATGLVEAPAVDADDATTEWTHVGEVTCRYEVPLDEVPEQPELLRSGDLVVRPQSLVWDHQGEQGVQYCEISEPLPEGAHLVVEVNDYGGGVGVWTGTSFIDPRQDSGSLPPDVVVVLPGQAVTAVRWMDYCPVDPSRACLAAGDVQALSALSSFDPNGPRSGWDFTETAFPLEPATQAGRALEAEACGLRVSLRGELACEGASVQALLPCLVEDYVNQAWGEEAEQEASAPAQLVFSDGVNEVAVVANETAGVSCIQNVVVVYGHAEGGMGSLRGF